MPTIVVGDYRSSFEVLLTMTSDYL